MSPASIQESGSIKGKRSKFLGVLCTLSGVNAMYGIVSGISTAVSPPDVDDTFINNLFEQLEKYELPIANLQDEVKEYYLNLMLDLGNFGAANFLFFAVQLIGVLMMYRLSRIGFTLYMVAQIGLAATPVIFASFNTFGKITFAMTLVWNAIWVIMYATQLKRFPK